MNFEHTEDRRMLSDMLRRFVAEQYDIATRHRNAGAERAIARNSGAAMPSWAPSRASPSATAAWAAPVSTSPWCSRRWGAAWVEPFRTRMVGSAIAQAGTPAQRESLTA